MNRVDDAARLFTERNSCSQAVFAAYAPSLGIGSSEALSLASGFGGGMHVGGTCGAATGAVLVLGVRYGGEDCGADRKAVMAAVESFYARFRERVGATDCPTILGCDVRTSQGMDTVREQGLRELLCLPAVRAAAEILEEMLATTQPEGIE